MDRLQQAINLYQAGRIRESEALLSDIVRIEPNNETAWWWLSAAAEDPQGQIHCLQQVLRINPYNQEARESLLEFQQGEASNFGSSGGDYGAPPVVTLPPQNPERALVRADVENSQRQQTSEFSDRVDDMGDRMYDTISGKLDDIFGQRRGLVQHLFLTVLIAVFLTSICAWTVSAFPSSFVTASDPTGQNNNPPSFSNPDQPSNFNQLDQTEGQANSANRSISFQVFFVTLTVFTVSWITYIFPALLILYFVVGYRLNGAWPHSQLFRMLLNLILGRSRTLRRQITLAIIVTVLSLPLLLSTVSGIYQLPISANETFGNYYEVGITINLIISLIVYSFVGFVVIYYLLAYVSNWQLTDDTSHYLFSNQVNKADRIYNGILERMTQRQLPRPYHTEFVTFTERGGQSMTEFSETTQLEITYKRARVAVRILEYGNDLYIRWDSYLDLSARRFSLLLGVLTAFVSGFFMWFMRQSLYEFIMLLWGILVGKGFKSQGSQALPFSTLLSPAYVDWSFIPSYMIDDLLALEDAVNQSVVISLQDIAIQAGVDEDIQMPIERNRGNTQNRVF